MQNWIRGMRTGPSQEISHQKQRNRPSYMEHLPKEFHFTEGHEGNGLVSEHKTS